MKFFKRTAAFVTALSFVMSVMPYTDYSIIQAAGEQESSFSWESLDEFKNFGLITDSRLIDSLCVDSPAIIKPVLSSDNTLTTFRLREPSDSTESTQNGKLTVDNTVSLNSTTVVLGDAVFNYSSNINFADREKMIVYGDLTLAHSLSANTVLSENLKLWEKPSVMCTGKLSATDFSEIGSDSNSVNIYCDSLERSANKGEIYGNILCTGKESNSTLTGTIHGNLFSYGSVEITNGTIIDGSLIVDGNLIVDETLNTANGLNVSGDIIVKGKIYGRSYMAAGKVQSGENADTSGYVFDSTSSDKLTFDDLKTDGFFKSGSVVPPSEVFENIYSSKASECSDLYGSIKNKNVSSSLSGYTLNEDKTVVMSGNCVLTPDVLMKGNREIHIKAGEDKNAYVSFGSVSEIMQCKIIVDDDVEKCYFILDEGTLSLNNSLIATQNYYNQITKNELEINDNDSLNIYIIGPEGSELRLENSTVTAHSYVQISTVNRGLPGYSGDVIYNGISENKASLNSFPVVVGSVFDCAAADGNSGQSIAYGGVYHVYEEQNPGYFSSVSATLVDSVTLNYKISPDDESETDFEGSYITFSSDTFEKKFFFDDVKPDKEGIYTFSIPVRPDCMTDDISAVIYNAAGSIIAENHYSVKQYFDRILDDPEKYDLYQGIAGAMLRYGARAQEYTEHNLSKPAYIFEDEEPVIPFIDDTYQCAVSYEGKGIKVKSASLLLGSKTSVRLKFNIPSGEKCEVLCKNKETGLYCNQEKLEISQDGTTAVVMLNDITPQNMDTMYQFTVTAGDSTAVVEYGAYTYIRSVMEISQDSILKNLVCSMYDLCQCANEIREILNPSSPEKEYEFIDRQAQNLSEGVTRTVYSSGTHYFSMPSSGKKQPVVFTVTGLDADSLSAYVYNNKKTVYADISKISEKYLSDDGDTLKYYIPDDSALKYYIGADNTTGGSYTVKAEYINNEKFTLEPDKEVSGTVTYKNWKTYKFTVPEDGLYRIKGTGSGDMTDSVKVSYMTETENKDWSGSTVSVSCSYDQVYSGSINDTNGKEFVLAAGDTINLEMTQNHGADSDYTFEIEKIRLESAAIALGPEVTVYPADESKIYEFTPQFDGFYSLRVNSCNEKTHNDSEHIFIDVYDENMRYTGNGEEDCILEAGKKYYYFLKNKSEIKTASGEFDFSPVNAQDASTGAFALKHGEDAWFVYSKNEKNVFCAVPANEAELSQMWTGYSADAAVYNKYGEKLDEDTSRSVYLSLNESGVSDPAYIRLSCTDSNTDEFLNAVHTYNIGFMDEEKPPAVYDIECGSTVSVSENALYKFTAASEGIYRFSNAVSLYADTDKSLLYTSKYQDSNYGSSSGGFVLYYMRTGETVYIQSESEKTLSVLSAEPTSDNTGVVKEGKDNQVFLAELNAVSGYYNVKEWYSFTAEEDGEYTFKGECSGTSVDGIVSCVYLDNKADGYKRYFSDDSVSPYVTVYLSKGQTALAKIMPVSGKAALSCKLSVLRDYKDTAQTKIPGLDYLGNGKYRYTASEDSVCSFTGLSFDKDYLRSPNTFADNVTLMEGETVYFIKKSGNDISVETESVSVSEISTKEGRYESGLYRFVPDSTGLWTLEGNAVDVKDFAGNSLNIKQGKNKVFAAAAGEPVYIDIIYETEIKLYCSDSLDITEMKCDTRYNDDIIRYDPTTGSGVGYTFAYSDSSYRNAWYSFTAEKDSVYEFRADGGSNISAALYDAPFGNRIDDSKGRTGVIKYDIKAGETVYLRVSAETVNISSAESNLIHTVVSVRCAGEPGSLDQGNKSDPKKEYTERVDAAIGTGLYNYQYGSDGYGKISDVYISFKGEIGSDESSSGNGTEYLIMTKSDCSGTLEVLDKNGKQIQTAARYIDGDIKYNVTYCSLLKDQEITLHMTDISDEELKNKTCSYDFICVPMYTHTDGSADNYIRLGGSSAAQSFPNFKTIVYTAEKAGNYTIRSAAETRNSETNETVNQYPESFTAVVDSEGNIIGVGLGELNVYLEEGESVYVRCLGSFDKTCMLSEKSIYRMTNSDTQQFVPMGDYTEVYSDSRYYYTADRDEEITLYLESADDVSVSFEVVSASGEEYDVSENGNIKSVKCTLKAGEKVFFSVNENDYSRTFNKNGYKLSVKKGTSSGSQNSEYQKDAGDEP